MGNEFDGLLPCIRFPCLMTALLDGRGSKKEPVPGDRLLTGRKACRVRSTEFFDFTLYSRFDSFTCRPQVFTWVINPGIIVQSVSYSFCRSNLIFSVDVDFRSPVGNRLLDIMGRNTCSPVENQWDVGLVADLFHFFESKVRFTFVRPVH